jgi:hypothetical protein
MPRPRPTLGPRALVPLAVLTALLAAAFFAAPAGAAPLEQLTSVVGNPIASLEPVLAADGKVAETLSGRRSKR